MRRIILRYGSITGAIIIGSMTLPLILDVNDYGVPEWLGYLIMLVAFTLIFLGIKRYRDDDLGGVIRFGTAFKLGIGITLVASAVYVVTWEAQLAATDHAFINDYTDAALAQKEADGLTGSALAAEVEEMEQLKERYANPLFRLPITFLEIFPVGLLITLISAGLLRNSSFMPSKVPEVASGA